uniref:Uncharacterized protein n=1 Tax=Anguilla anguilla TaxID=7936 RepID=A0A0E9XPG5_ANGAN
MCTVMVTTVSNYIFMTKKMKHTFICIVNTKKLKL